MGLVWTLPDFSARGHKIVTSFYLDRKKRPGSECVRCAICSSGHPKFLAGAVIWSPDQNLRLIGHRCAAQPEHFGEAAYRGMRQVRAQEDLDAFALEWLEAHVADLAAHRATLEAVRVCALNLEEQQAVFLKKARQLAEMLAARARRHGGTLVVSEQLSEARRINSASGAIQSLYEDIIVGTMRGLDFFNRLTNPRSRQLEGSIIAPAMVPDGQGEEPILALIDQGGQHRITIVAGAVFRALQLALRVAEQCESAALFVSDENLAALKQWGEDHRNPLRFTVRRYVTGTELALSDRNKIVIKAKWPELPDLGPLRRIVDAGIRLEKLRR